MKKLLTIILLAVSVAAIRAEKMEIEQLLTAEDIRLDSVPLGIIPGSGLCAIFGNSILTVDPTVESRRVDVAVGDTTVIDRFVSCGSFLAMKIHNSLVWTSATRGFAGITFEDSDFGICTASDSTVYVMRNSGAMELGLTDGRPKVSYTFDERPVTLQKLRDGIVAVTTRRVLSLYNGEWTLIHQHPCDIRCAAITPHGIFLGTDDGLWRCGPAGSVELLANGSISSLFYDRTVLYILDGTAGLYRLSWL